MAEATNREEAIDRHRAYPYDIAARLSTMQRLRIGRMLAPVRAGDVVLDVGCNSGYIVDFLPRSCTVFGVDVAEELVAKARARLARADVAPAEELPHADRSVDVVVLGEILEHVHDPLAVLLEARRVGRRLIVGSTPHERGEWGPRGKRAPARHRFHVRCFTEATLRQVLAAAGLVDLKFEEIAERGAPAVRVFRGAIP